MRITKKSYEKRDKISRQSFEEKVKEMVWRIQNREKIHEKLLEVLIKYGNTLYGFI